MATKTAAVETQQDIGLLAGAPVRMSWGAIFGGAVAALGVGALLHALGFALGLTAIDPNDPSSFRGSTMFTGIWSIVTSLIALFVGGVVAGRGAGVMTRLNGAMHGLVMWGLTTIFAALLIVSVLSRAIGGVAAVGKTALEQGMAAGAGLPQMLGLNAERIVEPINERLLAEGKPTITGQQLSAAANDVMRDAVREGRINRELLVASIADQTNLSRADAEELALQVEAEWNQARSQATGAATELQTGALQAAENTGKAFWGVFGAMLLGLLAAVFGATLGVSKRQRVWAQWGMAPFEGGIGGDFAAGHHPRTNP